MALTYTQCVTHLATRPGVIALRGGVCITCHARESSTVRETIRLEYQIRAPQHRARPPPVRLPKSCDECNE